MTISAKAVAPSSIALDAAHELYRDLTLALRGQIARLREDAGASGDTLKGQTELITLHQKSLLSVLELEARLGKRTQAGGGGVELDLDAARAEIRARLAQWLADR
jgi:hypothetical protein